MKVAATPDETSTSLESEAATALGYIIFEYSRLDMELGLFLVWSGEGQRLEQLTKSLNDSNFSNKLALLKSQVKSKYKGTPAFDPYAQWLNDAHAIRILRNDLFHGRWGFLPEQKCVANVVGLPTSPNQTETCYTIPQLQESSRTIADLRSRLSKLRAQWPV